MVRVDVAGDGTVASTTCGLACPERCAIAVPYRSVVRLVASPAATTSFAGWGGACSGTGECSITVVEDTTVSAAFAVDRELFVAKTVIDAPVTVTRSAAMVAVARPARRRWRPARGAGDRDVAEELGPLAGGQPPRSARLRWLGRGARRRRAGCPGARPRRSRWTSSRPCEHGHARRAPRGGDTPVRPGARAASYVLSAR